MYAIPLQDKTGREKKREIRTCSLSKYWFLVFVHTLLAVLPALLLYTRDYCVCCTRKCSPVVPISRICTHTTGFTRERARARARERGREEYICIYTYIQYTYSDTYSERESARMCVRERQRFLCSKAVVKQK